jgi:hypothetical protein
MESELYLEALEEGEVKGRTTSILQVLEDASDAVVFSEGAAPLDDCEPIALAKAISLSDIVLHDRR